MGRLRKMFGIQDSWMTDLPMLKAPQVTDTKGINNRAKQTRQHHPISARVKIKEKVNGKQHTHLGTSKSYKAASGLCQHVLFDDGEFEEFMNAELSKFKLTTPHAP